MAKHANASPSAQINMIGEGTTFEGTLRAKSDVRISGCLKGRLHVDGKVFVTRDGAIEGELVATNADVAGRLEGQVEVHERLLLKDTARLEGTVKTGRLVIEEGALFNGDCAMGQRANGKAAAFDAGRPAKAADGKVAHTS